MCTESLFNSLYTYKWPLIPAHPTNSMLFVRLISKGSEAAYLDEVHRLTVWCADNNLSPNIKKTQELIIDLRRNQGVVDNRERR